MSAFTEMMQEGFEKKAPNPNAFVLLPSFVVKQIGLRTHMGARIESALLSGFVFHAQQQAGSKTISYNTGEVIETADDVFIASMQTIIEDLYVRWFGKSPQENEKGFARFYEKSKKAIQRLVEKGYLAKLGYVNEKFLGTKGTFWSFSETKMQDLFVGCDVIPTHKFSISATQEVDLDQEEYINVVDLLSSAFVDKNHETHTHVEISTGIGEYGADRGRYMDYKDWSNLIANGTSAPSGDRHMSVGALVESEIENKETASYFIPHFIFDVDGDDPFDSYNTTNRVVDFFVDEMNISEEDIIVAYTGGDGFHVMIPSGAAGNPVFANYSKASGMLLRFKRLYLQENVDANLFDPRHLVRMIGSVHQKSGLYKTAYTAADFRSKSIYKIIEDSVQYRRFSIPDPTKVEVSEDFVLALMYCADSMDRIFVPKFSEIKVRERGAGSEVVQRALQGVERRGVWYSSDDKEYTGRNFAMFIAACHLIKKNDGNEYSAFSDLKEVNLKNNPPLSERELRICFESAMKTTGYARNRR